MAVAGAVAASASAASAAPSKPSAAPSKSGWSIQPTAPLVANPGVPTAGELASVSCTTSSACAAVGYQGFDAPPYPLGEQWDGTTWSLQPTPGFQGDEDEWLGVSCPSATTCSAVGHYVYTGGPVVPEAYQWDGSAWQQQSVPTPTPFSKQVNDVLTAVSCPSTNACTAVGYGFPPSGGVSPQPLVERWDGSAWTIQATPALSDPAQLFGVSCPTTTSCVAVGSLGGTPTGGGTALAEVWDGTSWTVEPVAAPSGAASPILRGVSCPTRRSCTAVGFFTVPSGTGTDVLVEHRSAGGRWRPETAPAPSGANAAALSAVSCPTQNTCTAVGNENVPGGDVLAVAERRSGGRWRLQTTPNPAGSTYTLLNGVSCPGRRTCVAVGTAAGPSQGITTQQPLAERWSGRGRRR